MEKTRPNIRQVEVSEIERFIANMGERPFRVKQIVEWLWQKHAHSYD
jgi:23S rRNA (adenine2503-C2)-methyltransferase